MNRTFMALQAAAVAVWLWVGFQVVSLLRAPSSTESSATAPGLPPIARIVLASHADKALARDPFQSFLYSEKPAPPKPVAAKVRVPAPAIDPPAVTVDGILMGDTPVAILKKDGKTELVKEGGNVWDITVIKITDKEVTVKKQGHSFILTYR